MTSEKMPRPLSVAKGEPTATVVSTPDASNKSDTAHKTTLTQSAKPILMADTSIATTKDNDSVAQPRVSMNVEEFQGEVQTTNELPTIETLRKIEAYNVLDSDGKSHSFKSLYAGRNSARRVLIIFIRHFFCGVCC